MNIVLVRHAEREYKEAEEKNDLLSPAGKETAETTEKQLEVLRQRRSAPCQDSPLFSPAHTPPQRKRQNCWLAKMTS